MSATEVLAYIQQHTLIGIRGGQAPRGFLNIWMVEVQGRIFARSWGLNEKSWYTAFLAEGEGALLCGEHEVPVKGVVPVDLEQIGTKINEAYLRKYTSAHNRPYAEGIARPAHMAKTLELIPYSA